LAEGIDLSAAKKEEKPVRDLQLNKTFLWANADPTYENAGDGNRCH